MWLLEPARSSGENNAVVKYTPFRMAELYVLNALVLSTSLHLLYLQKTSVSNDGQS